MNNFQETTMNKADDEPAEESSWTFYFEEFLCQNDQEMTIVSCNETLSDAASSAIVKKAVCIEDDQAKKLSLKKRKIRGTMIDDSLEDTASSPVSSPKVAYLDQVKIKNKNKTTLNISEENVGSCEEEKKTRVDPNMELKKRGLCLVPLSSLANFLS